MSAKPRRGRPPKPKAQLASVIKFDPDRPGYRESEDSVLARKLYDEAMAAAGAQITSLDAAADALAKLNAALHANHSAWYVFTVWEAHDHTPHNIRWSLCLQDRIRRLSDAIAALEAIEQNLQPPARVYDLAEYRRFAARVRAAEVRQ